MTPDYLIVFGILALTLFLFAWGKFRYDFVAIFALMTGVYLGVIPASNAFSGFGHPAVITVAAVLVISRALQNSGAVFWLAGLLAPTRSTTIRQVAAGSGLVALLSCVMNNVGALALMLPVTLRNARKARRSPSVLLMPLSFASLLGGLVTLIGTPTNIVISSYRNEFTGQPFNMFDFTPVGATVALVGLVYLALVGWRLLPQRVSAAPNSGIFHVEEYISEVAVPPGSTIVGKQVRQLERECENELSVMLIIRDGRKRHAPSGIERFRENDILILEGDPSILNPLITGGKLELADTPAGQDTRLGTEDVRVAEVVLLPNSSIEGQSMRGIRMHDRYGINLLAISRRGERPRTRLAKTRFRAGDILLIQGEANALEEGCSQLGLLALAERGLQSPQRFHVMMPIAVFGVAIALVALGLLPPTIAFVTVVIALIAMRTISAREVYNSVEWPVIVLLGALIPVGEALQTSGGTILIASAFTSAFMGLPIWLTLASLLVASMWLSDIIPNTPVAVLMAPIGAAIASQLGLATDPFLMAVAIGCATPFLTPIGHQSNTLVMGPGGYRFFDYARMGFGLELLIVIVAVPMIMWIWPV
ncbi:MAG: SLC13 family permease [Rhizobiaceae bacterium]